MRIRAAGRADVDADRRPVLVDGSVVAAFLFTTLSKLNQIHFSSIEFLKLFLVSVSHSISVCIMEHFSIPDSYYS